MRYESIPAHIHLSISASNVGWENEFLTELKNRVDSAAGLPERDLVKMVRAELKEVDLVNISDADIMDLLAMAGLEGQGLPNRMADINGVLDELPAEAREKILVSFVNDLFVQ